MGEEGDGGLVCLGEGMDGGVVYLERGLDCISHSYHARTPP